MVISFNELDLILSLLRDMPGARWKVTHTSIERQVEDVTKDNGIDSNSEDNVLGGKEAMPTSIPLKSSGDGTAPLNVLIARCSSTWQNRTGEDDNIDSKNGHRDVESSSLDFDAVCRHVKEVNDRWFQEKQPLLTNQRIQDLKRAFSVLSPPLSPKEVIAVARANVVTNKNSGVCEESNYTKVLSIEEAYDVLFTEAEREHLTYEHFLEDWWAFLQEEKEEQPSPQRRQQSDNNSTTNTPTTGIDTTAKINKNNESKPTMMGITYDLAIKFLRANQ